MYLPEWVATKRAKTESEFWKDDVSITRRYGAWRSPRENATEDRMDACREFRRFDDLFFANEGSDPGRLLFLLDAFLHDLSVGQFPYTVRCIDKRPDDRGIECDPKKGLQAISIYSSFSGSTTAERALSSSHIRTDILDFDVGQDHGHPVILSIRFESEQRHGEQSSDQADILSATVTFEVA